MRHMFLVAQPRGITYNERWTPNDELWMQVLPRLMRLWIIAEQPVAAAGYSDAPTLEQEMNRWMQWITRLLSCLGTHLSNETVVYVDVGYRPETRELFRAHLPHGFSEGGCGSLADLIFQRGRFSLESGYWDDDGGP